MYIDRRKYSTIPGACLQETRPSQLSRELKRGAIPRVICQISGLLRLSSHLMRVIYTDNISVALLLHHILSLSVGSISFIEFIPESHRSLQEPVSIALVTSYLSFNHWYPTCLYKTCIQKTDLNHSTNIITSRPWQSEFTTKTGSSLGHLCVSLTVRSDCFRRGT